MTRPALAPWRCLSFLRSSQINISSVLHPTCQARSLSSTARTRTSRVPTGQTSGASGQPQTLSAELDKVRARQAFGLYSDGRTRRRLQPGEHIQPHEMKPSALIPDSQDPSKSKRRPMVRFGPKRAEAHLTDPFLRYRINPLHEPHNTELLTPYVSALGKIKGRHQTGLTLRNQKRVAKAIRRARCMGLMPYFGSANRDDF